MRNDLNNSSINLDQNEIEALRGTFNGYKYQEQEHRNRFMQVDHNDMASHAFQGENLFTALEDVMSSWGTDAVNYSRLEHIFSIYLSHKPGPETVQETFKLYSKLFMLVAKILESKEFILFELNKYERFLTITGSFNDKGEDNEQLIFPDTAA
jgi:hypothetical protein